MSEPVAPIGRFREARVRRAACLIAAGLVVELLSLYWNHALSFILFGGVGAMLTGSGILLYLYVVATRPRPETPAAT